MIDEIIDFIFKVIVIVMFTDWVKTKGFFRDK